MKKEKKAQSNIIAIILLIFIIIVAIIIIWNIVSPLIKKNSNKIITEPITIGLSYEKKPYSIVNCLIIAISRNSLQGELEGIRFNYRNSSGSASYYIEREKSKLPKELETKQFKLCYPQELTIFNVSKIYFIPLFKDRNRDDAYGAPSEEQDIIIRAECTPKTCSDLEIECIPPGSAPDDGCGSALTCPACPSSKPVCNSLGKCICIPESAAATCGTAVCGKKLNNCNQEIECGTCEIGKACDATGQCIPIINCYNSSKDPIQLCTCADLDKTRNLLNKNYILKNSIDCSGFPDFSPIGDSANKFTGTFDGSGLTITKLTIKKPVANYIGLFGYINNANIKNLTLTNLNVSGYNYVGGLAGGAFSSIINSVSVSGNITGNFYTGGLVGYNTGIINNSNTRISVSGTNTIGGLAGNNEGNIDNSYSIGNVSSISYSTGGLVGQSSSGVISDSYTIVNVSGKFNRFTGGLVGITTSGNTKIINCSATGNIIGSIYTGGLVGDNAASITSSHSFVNVTGSSYVGGLVGMLDDKSGAQINNSYSIGNVTGSGNIGGLAGIAYNPIINSYAIANIKGISFVGGLVGVCFSNISNSSFNGNVIATSDNAYVGGLCGDSIGIINDSFSIANISGKDNTGGLVGRIQRARIDNSYSKAVIVGRTNTGGLVGYNIGSNISRCYAISNVTGAGNTGGLAGTHSQSLIIDSYSRSSVTIIANGYSVGGIAGVISNNANITNSYSTGDVSGYVRAGGIAGTIYEGYITNSYSTGKITCTLANNAGGLVGINYNTGSWITNSYWFDNPGDSATICYNGNSAGACIKANAVTDFFAKEHDVYTLKPPYWDFDNIWYNNSNDYPILRWQITRF